jgi:hypothetical protein
LRPWLYRVAAATDFALGHFASKENVLRASAEIVQSEWRDLFESYDQSRWEYLFDEGLIDRALADDLANEVWAEGDEDDMDDDLLAS